MRRFCLRLLIAALLAGAALPALAGDPQISLLTFGPGEVYWERFGHNALLVRDTDGDTVYNYGLFDFRQKNFFLNFARGRMVYRLAADSLNRTLWFYDREGRWTVEQRLNLSPAQSTALAEYLRWNARPENAEYRYDYFIANCSTRVRDVLDHALGGELHRQLAGKPAGVSYRWEAVRLISPDLALALAMDAGLGPSADHPLDVWEQSFVPMALMQGVRDVRIPDQNGQPVPLVAGERQLLNGELPDAPSAPPDLRRLFLMLGVSGAALLLIYEFFRQRLLARLGFSALASTLTLAFGIVGLAFAAIWGLSEHWAGWRNPTLLLFNPLCLLLLPGWLRSARASWQPSMWHRRLTILVALLALASLPLTAMGIGAAKLQWIALALPMHLALAFAVRRR